MSALPFEKQIKHFFPFTKEMAKTSNGSGGFLDMTTSDFIANAANGDIRLFNEDGTTDTATGRFYFLRKTTSGKIVKSDLFDPARVKYYNLAAPRNKTGKTQVFTLSGVTANAVIVANLKLNYATSERNFATIFADVKVDATGDTPVKVLTKLAKALALTLASDIKTSTSISGDDVIITGTSVKKNKYFKITVAAGVLTIAEKDWILDGYVPGLKTHDQLMWNLELQTTSEAQAAQIVKTETAPIYAKGAGYQMKELERYFSAHRGDFYAADQTVEFGYTSEISTGSTYYALDVRYYDTGVYDPQHSDKEMLLVCSNQSNMTALYNSFVAVL